MSEQLNGEAEPGIKKKSRWEWMAVAFTYGLFGNFFAEEVDSIFGRRVNETTLAIVIWVGFAVLVLVAALLAKRSGMSVWRTVGRVILGFIVGGIVYLFIWIQTAF